MKRSFRLTLIHLILIFGISSGTYSQSNNSSPDISGDTIKGNQLLNNGRIWRDLYVAVQEDQFLFTNEFLPGQLTMNGKVFTNLRLRYDILNDEIMTVTDKGFILQLNKEMVDGFTVTYSNRNYNFSHLVFDSLNKLEGYVNVLYKDKSALYIKYFKEISKRGPGKNYENFVQSDRVYIVKEGIVHQIRNKKDFKGVISDKKLEIKQYMKGSGLRISRKSPDTFVLILEYYDRLR